MSGSQSSGKILVQLSLSIKSPLKQCICLPCESRVTDLATNSAAREDERGEISPSSRIQGTHFRYERKSAATVHGIINNNACYVSLQKAREFRNGLVCEVSSS